MADIRSYAAEMAAKMAQRAIIREAIKRVQEKIDAAREVKIALNNINRQIADAVNRWARTLASFQSSVMAPVVVTDRFEGDAAERISIRLPQPIAEMESTRASAQGVQGEISTQLAKLDLYINKLEDEKDKLLAELAAI
ncbi:MAG: hypothetical protein HDR71_16075 [Lachnospiraceae bacterium]|nr:hypothetical protein [Lachnospiraceae bacterium]